MKLFSTIVVAIMVVFAFIAVIDRLFLKNKFGLGIQFQKGLELIGPLCLIIVGIYSLVPVISEGLKYTITPLFTSIGMSPSVAISTILAPDMGGFALSEAVMGSSGDKMLMYWATMVYGSMMGTTIIFSIPVGLSALQKKNVNAFSKGILYGISAIPFGAFVGGLVMGLPVLTILLNLVPAIIFSVIVIVCLSLWQKKTIAVFKGFSYCINVIALLGLVCVMVKDLVLAPLSTEFGFDVANIPFFNMLYPASEGILISGNIGLILAGTLPLVTCLSKWLKKPLGFISKKTGFSDAGIMGFLLTSANNMAMFETTSKMKEKEVSINVAFSVGASFVIGDHLAFAATMAPESMAGMMVGKLFAAVVAVIITVLISRRKSKKGEEVVDDGQVDETAQTAQNGEANCVEASETANSTETNTAIEQTENDTADNIVTPSTE